MTIIQSIILGTIQGLTEFFPISSSAHLVIAPYLLGWNIPAQEGFIFDVLVQLGTLLAVIVYFRKDLVRIIRAVIEGVIRRKPFEAPESRLGWLLAFTTGCVQPPTPVVRQTAKVEGKYAPEAIKTLADIAKKGTPGARVSAAIALLDRAYGKTPTFSTTDTQAFKRAIDMTDDELAAIASRAKLTVV